MQGNFKRISSDKTPAVDPKTFQASPSEAIQVGQQVLHLMFGEGKVDDNWGALLGSGTYDASLFAWQSTVANAPLMRPLTASSRARRS